MNGELIRAEYRSIGPELQIDALCVYFEYDGEVYMHDLPNPGWSLNNLALGFIAFIGKRPTDAENGTIDLNGTVPIQEHPNDDGYLINQSLLLQEGPKALERCDWFNAEGEVGSTDDGRPPGMVLKPNGGGKAGVPLEQ